MLSGKILGRVGVREYTQLELVSGQSANIIPKDLHMAQVLMARATDEYEEARKKSFKGFLLFGHWLMLGFIVYLCKVLLN